MTEVPCMCLVQEGQIAADVQARLRDDMTAFARRAFDATPQFAWIEVAKGDGFTEAKPSNSIIVSMTAPRPLDQAQREPLIRELGDIWLESTGLSLNEVVAAVNDPAA